MLWTGLFLFEKLFVLIKIILYLSMQEERYKINIQIVLILISITMVMVEIFATNVLLDLKNNVKVLLRVSIIG
jgi:hypothetical protein